MPVLVVGHVLRHAQMLHLRIGEDLVDRIDGTAGDAGGVELLDPGLARFLHGVFVDLGVELLAVLRTLRPGGIFGTVRKVGSAQRLAEAYPYPSARGGDVDVAVGGLEYAGRNGG